MLYLKMVLGRALWQPTYGSIGKPSGFISVANLDDGPSAVFPETMYRPLIKRTFIDNIHVTSYVIVRRPT